ncbi:MAG TPA: UDP-glucose/GDP-mannose dehydrogenase family protein, partial [Acidimicrobiales bacterium]|nr:UDP-glucose/GDP-mannose dehydrogenase family protein [Acidimicrobiales bacterium]
MAEVAVIGAGNVGLATAASLANLGHWVCCADAVADKVAALSAGEVPIPEEGLAELVGDGLASGRLRFVLGAPAAVAGREIAFICVPTPQAGNGAADLSQVLGVAREIGPHLAPGAVVVTKSTAPVGSTRLVGEALSRDDVGVVANPEFLREGSAVRDCLHPERIVIGADDRAAAVRVAALFEGIGAPVLITDPPTAELTKYACNAFLATKASFVNAIACLCEAVGADVADVVVGMGYDHRIGFDYLRPGPGWGGSCLPKDTAALVRMGEEAGYDFDLLRGVIATNQAQREAVVAKIRAMAGDSLQGRLVGVWGLAFKAGTDDLRDSPALAVIERLVRAGARVRAYDPAVRGPFEGIEVCPDPYTAAQGASVLAVLTEWEELRALDFDKVAAVMA